MLDFGAPELTSNREFMDNLADVAVLPAIEAAARAPPYAQKCTAARAALTRCFLPGAGT